MVHKKLLLVLLLVCSLFLMISCEKDKDDNKTYHYSAGFSSMSSSSENFLEEMSTIEQTFYSNLGITQTPFTLTGSQNECDAQVKSACEVAATTLQELTWDGTYQYDVTNVDTGETIFTLKLE
ncbi:MAG: hypothetical protein LBM67_07700 [Lentimicrobiaceae bacterium]|jgi:hypothetical protein|nr:hypothetical protein [Lentimicrobiaceae bacterium]